MRNLLCALLLLPLLTFADGADSLTTVDSAAVRPFPIYKLPVNKGGFRNISTYIPPALFISYGFMSLHNKAVQQVDHRVYTNMQASHAGFSTSVDNYLQHAPLAIAGALELSGLKGKNKFKDQVALFAISAGIVSSSVTYFKRNTEKFRPDQSSRTSFPSSHTSRAFAAAEFLNQEYGDRSIWYGIIGYSAATATGILRVYNNAHWFSDVVAGAGFGILSVKASYLVYPYLKKTLNGRGKGRSNLTVMPSYQNGHAGIGIFGNL